MVKSLTFPAWQKYEIIIGLRQRAELSCLCLWSSEPWQGRRPFSFFPTFFFFLLYESISFFLSLFSSFLFFSYFAVGQSLAIKTVFARCSIIPSIYTNSTLHIRTHTHIHTHIHTHTALLPFIHFPHSLLYLNYLNHDGLPL